MMIALVISLSVISLIFSLILLREFLEVTYKRRMLIATLGGRGRSVRSFKYTIMSSYLFLSITWSIVLPLYYFWIFRWS